MAFKCPHCGKEINSPAPWTKRLHWRYPGADSPLCMVSRQKMFQYAEKEEDITCKNCLKELAYRRSKGFTV